MKKSWYTIEECITEDYIEIKTKNLLLRVFKSEEVVLEDYKAKGYAPMMGSYDREMGGFFFANPTVISQLVSKEDE